MLTFRAKNNITALTKDDKVAATGSELAENIHYSDYIKEIQSLVALPNEYYSTFYKLPLENFLAIYQPCDIDLIQLKLKNVIKALKLRRPHNLPFEVKPEDVKGYKDIWTYVIFIAALLYKIPDLTEYAIAYKKPDIDNAYKMWNPFTGAITPGYVYIVKNNSNKYKNLAPLTLLPLLLSHECTSWLYSDSAAFNCMLELSISPDPESILGSLIIDSNNQYNQKNHIGHELYFLLTEVMNKNIDRYDKIHNYICQTNDGYAIATPDIFNYYSASTNVESKVIEECFYSLNLYKKPAYKVTFPNIGKKDAVILLDKRL